MFYSFSQEEILKFESNIEANINIMAENSKEKDN